MKKLLSLALTLLMMISAFVIPCTTAQAKAVKKKPNTYVASEAFYNTSKGLFYAHEYDIMFKGKDGKIKKIVNWREDEDICKFYVRKDTLYYNGADCNLHAVKTSGKNDTVIYFAKLE